MKTVGLLQDEYLSAQDLASLLGLKLTTVYNQWPRWKKEHELRVIKVNGSGSLRFHREDVEKMLKTWEI